MAKLRGVEGFLFIAAAEAVYTDAQCGFKAVRADVAAQLLPLITDEAWFFDTELLVLAERAGLRIHEVPVDWADDPVSSVDIVATAAADLRGVARMRRQLRVPRLRLRLTAIGAVPLPPVPLQPVPAGPAAGRAAAQPLTPAA